MLWRRSGSAGWTPSVNWICVALLMGASLSAGSGRCETPLPESWPVVAQTDSTITILTAEYEFLLLDRAHLVADLRACETRLGWSSETPPECVGEPALVKFAIVLVVGVCVGVVAF